MRIIEITDFDFDSEKDEEGYYIKNQNGDYVYHIYRSSKCLIDVDAITSIYPLSSRKYKEKYGSIIPRQPGQIYAIVVGGKEFKVNRETLDTILQYIGKSDYNSTEKFYT